LNRDLEGSVISFDSLLVVGVVAVAVPLLLGLVPALRVPAVALEILGGVLVGPAVLGWVHLDAAVVVVSDLGLGYLLFMAGYEIDLRRFDQHTLLAVGRAYLVSGLLAICVAYGFKFTGLINDALLVVIVMMSTSLGVLVPVLKDVGETDTQFGRLIMAAGSVAELAPLVLISVFFSVTSHNPGTELGLLAGFVAVTAAAIAVIQRVRRWPRLRELASRLENTTAQLRVRVAITLPLAFGVVAAHFGLAMILGAFLAGVVIRRVDQAATNGETSDVLDMKLQAIGFGFLIPVFFVTTGAYLDVSALFDSRRALAAVPVFLVALLVVRGLPALLYAPIVGRARAIAAGFMQATTLTFVVVATTIGVETHHQRTSTAAAFVVAGLLSVVFYPLIGLRLLAGE
jgi:Kef-type K+ transport system membrane component KefB